MVRSISLRGANHLVLKSLRPTLRRHYSEIRQVLRETQDRFGVKISALAVMGDHIHLVLRVSSRTQWANALRFLTGQLAQRIAGAKLWRARAWSRPVQTHRDLWAVERYVASNPIKAKLWSLADSFMIVDGVLRL